VVMAQGAEDDRLHGRRQSRSPWKKATTVLARHCHCAVNSVDQDLAMCS